MKRKAGLLIGLSIWSAIGSPLPLLLGQNAQDRPPAEHSGDPSQVPGPQLVVWSETQRPQPIPQRAPEPNETKQEEPTQQDKPANSDDTASSAKSSRSH
jgi:hypothetical protein